MFQNKARSAEEMSTSVSKMKGGPGLDPKTNHQPQDGRFKGHKGNHGYRNRMGKSGKGRHMRRKK